MTVWAWLAVGLVASDAAVFAGVWTVLARRARRLPDGRHRTGD